MHSARKLLIAVLTVFMTLAVAVTAQPASAEAALPQPYGRIASTLQHRDGTITVVGWAYDRSRPDTSITACLVVVGKCVRAVRANRASKNFDRQHHITGAHTFRALVPASRRGVTVQLRAYPGPSTLLNSVHVLSPGARVIRLARRYVGRTPYVYGGASPRSGFDCSGYAMYTYKHAKVANLPHNAEAQRHARHMHRIPRSKARPGDLIFYFAGGSAYHVAIYAGHGRQYSATDPQQGIRYQKVWAHNIEFRSDWH